MAYDDKMNYAQKESNGVPDDRDNCFWGKKGLCTGWISEWNNCRLWDKGKTQGMNYVNYHCNHQVPLAEGEILEEKIREIDIPDIQKVRVNDVEVSIYVYFCYSCGRRMRVVDYDCTNEELCEHLVREFKFFKKQSPSITAKREKNGTPGYSPYYNYCECGAIQGYPYLKSYINQYPYSYVLILEKITAKIRAQQEYFPRTALDWDYWKKQRNKKIKDENYTCQRCASTRHVQVHHIIPKELFKLEDYRLAHALDNLLVVCARCHPTEEKNSRGLIERVKRYVKNMSPITEHECPVCKENGLLSPAIDFKDGIDTIMLLDVMEGLHRGMGIRALNSSGDNASAAVTGYENIKRSQSGKVAWICSECNGIFDREMRHLGFLGS